MIDQINELPEDELTSLPETSRKYMVQSKNPPLWLFLSKTGLLWRSVWVRFIFQEWVVMTCDEWTARHAFDFIILLQIWRTLQCRGMPHKEIFSFLSRFCQVWSTNIVSIGLKCHDPSIFDVVPKLYYVCEWPLTKLRLLGNQANQSRSFSIVTIFCDTVLQCID